MLALLLLAVSVGLSNLAAAIGIGLSGVSRGTRVRVTVVFGVFEAGMPLLGLVLGRGVASGLGPAARWLGGAVLAAVGAVSLIRAWRAHRGAGRGADADGDRGGAPAAGRGRRPEAGREWQGWRVLAAGFALSVDNLAAGFALGAYHTGLALAAVVFGLVSAAMSLAGLELGARIGGPAGDRGELIASALLIAVGAAMAAGAF